MEVYEVDDNALDAIGLGCSLERFAEWEEIIQLINDLKEDKDQDMRMVEKAIEKFKYIINQYQEQPHLLDSHLPQIFDGIVEIVLNPQAKLEIKHRAFKYFHLVTNVRGYKFILQHLPHAVSDFEPVLSMLESQDHNDLNTWETRYCLLIWLSILVKIPFPLARLDDTTDESQTVTFRLLSVCKMYIMANDICRNASAYLLSQFLTRSDTSSTVLPKYLEWASELIRQNHDKKLGPLYSLAALLKHGKRLDILPHANALLQVITFNDWRKEPFRLSRKFAIKIIQRIGLTYLKERVIAWRYKRGRRMLPEVHKLIENNKENDTIEEDKENKLNQYNIEIKENVLSQENDGGGDDEEEDQEVPQEIEIVIEQLMQGLRDEDITVRWSAAKGVGRVMGRMNKQFGDEVIGFVLELLTPRENERAWHGGCLALAEFSKRGLLLPSRLPEVIPLIKRALVYDEPQGYTSVGINVRDAACYVTWTFARAYDSVVFQPYVSDIATSLVVVFCLDREVNIRRAAAAAFQEHIGRQGTFPHGIDILTEADYFTVGALHNLTPLAPQYMIDTVLPSLIIKNLSIDANVRHGSIIAVGEIIQALSLLGKVRLSDSMMTSIANLVTKLKERHMFKGVSGELMKVACCQFINKCSQARLPFRWTKVIDDWQEILNECLCHEVVNIRTNAATALPSLCSEYYCCNGEPDIGKCAEIIKFYTEMLEGNNETTRVGHSLALGSLPGFVLDGHVDIVVNKLIKCTVITQHTEKWVDCRRSAVKALTSICSSVGISNPDPKKSCQAHVLEILYCMVEGLKDYTKDDRGDTGAWVRESCMSSIQAILQLVTKQFPSLLTQSIVSSCFIGLVQQAVERIDRTRALAGTVFAALEYEIPYIPEKEKLIEHFPEKACKEEINWLSNTDTFPRFVKLLKIHSYSYSVLFGLIGSVGGLTESLVKTSTSCFFDYLKGETKEEIDRICDLIIAIYKSNTKLDRVVIPLLNFLDKLLSSLYLRPILEDPNSEFPMIILNLTKEAVTGTTHKYKLLGSVDVYCQLMQVKGDVGRKSISKLYLLLCHRFGWLRKATATKMYEALVIYGDDILNGDNNKLETALAILSDTEWGTDTVENLRLIRNNLAQQLGVPPPQLVKTVNKN